MIKILLLFLGICLLSSSSQSYEVSNGYFFLSGRDGCFDVLRLDPAGNGKYGENIIKVMSFGGPTENGSGIQLEQLKSGIILRNIAVKSLFKIKQEQSGHPIACPSQGTLGVKFEVGSGKITSVSGSFPTWHETNCGCTLTLYRLPDGDFAKKEVVARRVIVNVQDNSRQGLQFDPQPAGIYYLEMSAPIGKQIGWWATDNNVNSSMVAYIDGKEQSNIDFVFECEGFTDLAGDVEITLKDSKLKSEFKLKESSVPSPNIQTWVVMPWKKSGYDVAIFPFKRFYTDAGQHIIVQEFKRRPFSDHLRPSKWVYAMGRKNADIRFDLQPGQHLRFEFEEDSAKLKFNGATLEMEVLPHKEELPSYYPVFYSSDKNFDKVLNEFYYSHALNFGVGTPPEWKEWCSRIHCWTANPQRDEQKNHFLNPSMREDGYIYTWGSQEGWPFPFKDEDNDGKNDYDTRHFTTNSCFILGAYHYFTWTRDIEFLKAVMPKLRKAMDFQLNQLKGKDGIIVIDAKGHEGKHNGIGSNYWDILPFGYKDAFCNTFYYESLRAMADLEDFCAKAGLDLAGEKKSANYYRNLRVKVRREYNLTFWDQTKGRYVGCVDVDGVKHDYGFTFINLEAVAYGLADQAQVERIYCWMETEPTSSGKADTYSAWIFAPRANTIHNPRRDEPQEPIPSWWYFGWAGTDYGDQCQDGGAILYTSYYDLMARVKYLGADNAFKRFKEILDRYWMPDRLCGGSPLYRGEKTQGGPGGQAGSVGVEGEFPESGLVPCAFLYGFLGIEADTEGLKIRPNLPSSLKYAGVRNLCYAGTMYDIKVTNDSVEIRPLNVLNPMPIKAKLAPGETFILTSGRVISR
ncbi:MAG: glycoside hydrolase family 116 protein [Armatimonadetes bacterium]|nr:glycoside hydrolase family 116 protein [Armatimonadota bacterium]